MAKGKPKAHGTTGKARSAVQNIPRPLIKRNKVPSENAQSINKPHAENDESVVSGVQQLQEDGAKKSLSKPKGPGVKLKPFPKKTVESKFAIAKPQCHPQASLIQPESTGSSINSDAFLIIFICFEWSLR